jgi:hypothetical protein
MRVALEVRSETHLLEIMSQLAEYVPCLKISRKEMQDYRRDMQEALRVDCLADDVEEEVSRVSKAAMGVFRRHMFGVSGRLPKDMAIMCTPYPSVIIVTDEKEHMNDGEIIAKGTCSLAAK